MSVWSTPISALTEIGELGESRFYLTWMVSPRSKKCFEWKHRRHRPPLTDKGSGSSVYNKGVLAGKTPQQRPSHLRPKLIRGRRVHTFDRRTRRGRAAASPIRAGFRLVGAPGQTQVLGPLICTCMYIYFYGSYQTEFRSEWTLGMRGLGQHPPPPPLNSCSFYFVVVFGQPI